MHSCTHWLRPRNSPPSPRIWAHIRGRYWPAKIDDISVQPPVRASPTSTFYFTFGFRRTVSKALSKMKLSCFSNLNKINYSNSVYCVPEPVSLQNGKSRSFPALLRIRFRIRIDLLRIGRIFLNPQTQCSRIRIKHTRYHISFTFFV